jgi:hypothetical protein
VERYACGQVKPYEVALSTIFSLSSACGDFHLKHTDQKHSSMVEFYRVYLPVFAAGGLRIGNSAPDVISFLDKTIRNCASRGECGWLCCAQGRLATKNGGPYDEVTPHSCEVNDSRHGGCSAGYMEVQSYMSGKKKNLYSVVGGGRRDPVTPAGNKIAKCYIHAKGEVDDACQKVFTSLNLDISCAFKPL